MQMFSPEEVAEQLNVSAAYVKRKVWSKQWPCLRFDRKIRFTQKQIDRIVGMHEQETAQETPGLTRQQLTAIGASPNSARQRRRLVGTGAGSPRT